MGLLLNLELMQHAQLITICTVVQSCCKGDSPCQWNTPIFRPSEIRNPWTDLPYIKLDRDDYVGDLIQHANFGIFTLKGAILHMREIVIDPLPPLLTFLFLVHLQLSHRLTDFRVVWLKRRVSATATSFVGVRTEIYIFSIVFRKKYAKFAIPAV